MNTYIVVSGDSYIGEAIGLLERETQITTQLSVLVWFVVLFTRHSPNTWKHEQPTTDQSM